MKTPLLISGYYGYNNLGDEAVLGGLLAGLRAELPEVEPVVLSADPPFTTRLHGVTAIPRMNLGVIRRHLHTAKLFLSGGGSLLQDVTSLQSSFYYLGLLWLAQREGVPTMLVAQGIGPLRRKIVRHCVSKVLNNTRAITVRDDASAELLASLGVTIPPIEVTADPSFLLEPEIPVELESWWNAHIPSNRPVLGVALRQWDLRTAAERYHAISDALAALAEETGAFLLFLPMQADQDTELAMQMAGWTPAESRVLTLPLTPRGMLGLVGRCDAIVAMRLHTLIFAVQRGTPAYGLSYDPKVLDFCRLADLPVTQWEDITGDGLTTALHELWAGRDALREKMTASCARLTEKAWQNIRGIKQALEQ